MSVRRSRFLPALAAAVMMLASMAFASAEEVVTYEAATEKLFISAGCPPEATGTCTSTRWLGREAGDATSNFITSITPVDEAFYRAEGSLNWRDYSSDETLRAEGYPLRADQPLVQAVKLEANGPAVQMTIHGKIEAVTEAGQAVTFGPLEQTVNVLPQASHTATFEFDIPAELEGVALDSLTAWVAVHGVNVEAGHIDQEGGSSVTIPFWDAVEPVVVTPTP